MSQRTNSIHITGGCYCKAIRFEAEGKPRLRAQCHCRACQIFSGGGPNYFMLMPPTGFRYTSGSPKSFKHPVLPEAVTREFCADCGTHLTTRRPGLSEIVLKVGTFDDPTVFDRPRMAIFTNEMQSFHHIDADLPAFATLPPS